MTSPEFSSPKSVPTLPPQLTPSSSLAAGGTEHLNPLFKSETLKQLATALLQEIERVSREAERADLLNAAKAHAHSPSPRPSLLQETAPVGITSVPTPPLLGATPSFYFLEELTYPTATARQPKSHPYPESGIFYVPQLVDQSNSVGGLTP